jgi:hypothetical protein
VVRWRKFVVCGPFSVPQRMGHSAMSDKSPRSSMSKKQGKSLKEKRADKKMKASGDTGIDISATVKKR